MSRLKGNIEEPVKEQVIAAILPKDAYQSFSFSRRAWEREQVPFRGVSLGAML